MGIKIGLDIDGVLADFLTSILLYLNREAEVTLTLNDVTTWSFYKKVGISDREFSEYLHKWGDLGGYANLGLMPGCEDYVKELLKNYEVFFITNRDEKHRSSTEEWFSKHFPEAKKENIHFTQDKGSLAVELGITHFVDDKPENVINVSLKDPDINCVILSAVHNKDISVSWLPIVKDWKSLMEKWEL